MKVILLCGKMCSGKSYYAEKLKVERNAVLLSPDEAISCIFPNRTGDQFKDVFDRVKAYLYRKSLDIIKTGTEVILDFGFWTSAERRRISKYFEYNGVQPEWHYIDVSEEVWLRNIERRNRRIREGLSTDFYLDDKLIEQFEKEFEAPSREEMDYWHENTDQPDEL